MLIFSPSTIIPGLQPRMDLEYLRRRVVPQLVRDQLIRPEDEQRFGDLVTVAPADDREEIIREFVANHEPWLVEMVTRALRRAELPQAIREMIVHLVSAGLIPKKHQEEAVTRNVNAFVLAGHGGYCISGHSCGPNSIFALGVSPSGLYANMTPVDTIYDEGWLAKIIFLILGGSEAMSQSEYNLQNRLLSSKSGVLEQLIHCSSAAEMWTLLQPQ